MALTSAGALSQDPVSEIRQDQFISSKLLGVGSCGDSQLGTAGHVSFALAYVIPLFFDNTRAN
jgi:hypothetical protein